MITDDLPLLNVPVDSTGSGKILLVVVTLVAVAAAELIGPAHIKLGPGRVVLLPMLWALLMASAWGLAQHKLPRSVRISTRLQSYAGGLLDAGLLLFIVKLGLTAGTALPMLRQAGWALVFQEFGHALGTLAMALPLALLLGIKREAIGATFSVGREGNLVIIGGKYGMTSPEGRGVLAEYITGTVLGALFIAGLAGFVASLHVLDPRSLAMGAGIGSGSMMAAAIGAITAQQPAESVPMLTALAAASNLLTLGVGFYFTLFLSLPLCAWLYARMEPVLGRFAKPRIEAVAADAGEVEVAGPPLTFTDMLLAWGVMAAGVAIGNGLTYKVPVLTSLEGMAVVIAVAVLVEAARRLLPRLPRVLTLSVVATVIGIPGLLPFGDSLIALTGKLNFLAFTTPVLALAGFSVAKDLPMFRRLGWRIVLVSLTAAAGSFIGATLVAELFR